MNIKEGYKQTEIGIIPEDWEVEKFSDVTDVITCGLAATPTYVSEQNGKPFLSAQNVNSGKVILNKYKFITNDLFYQITKHNSPEKGDLLYTRVGAGIGEAGVIETDLKFGIYVSLTLIKTNKKVLDNYFLLHILNSPNYKFLAKNGQLAGGGVQNLNVQTVKEFPIILPPLKEQTAIATALSDIDALIGELDKLIAKKQGIKQATMQQLLTGKKRLAGFGSTSKYKQTELGIIPEDWAVKKLGEIIDKGRLGGNYPNQDTPSSKPLIKMGNISRGQITLSKIEYIPESINIKSEHCLKLNDVLFNTRNTLDLVGKVAIWREELPYAYYNSNLMRLEFNSGFISSNAYINYALNTKSSIDNLRGIATGTTSVAAIYTRDLIQFQIPIPPLKEQTAIANILSDMDAEISQLEGRRAKMGELKQGMMQELLTGRIRLNTQDSTRC